MPGKAGNSHGIARTCPVETAHSMSWKRHEVAPFLTASQHLQACFRSHARHRIAPCLIKIKGNLLSKSVPPRHVPLVLEEATRPEWLVVQRKNVRGVKLGFQEQSCHTSGHAVFEISNSSANLSHFT